MRRKRGERGRSSPDRKETGLGAYLTEAFKFRWNLLALAGVVGAAVISPITPVLLPLIGAVELAYLTGLVSSPKFRSWVDRKLHEKQRGEPAGAEASPDPNRMAHELLARLPRPSQQRFHELRERCLEMRAIASGVGGRATKKRGGAEEVANPGLDRLLWVYLRLLVSEDSLHRFLDATDEAAIESQIAETQRRLAESESRGDERMIRSIRDTLATSELRLDNYRKAHQNAEFVSVELDRLGRKIQTLSEMSVNRQDPDFISREVDSVAESITHTEAAMNELQLVTGLMQDLDQPPVILASDFQEALDHDS